VKMDQYNGFIGMYVPGYISGRSNRRIVNALLVILLLLRERERERTRLLEILEIEPMK